MMIPVNERSKDTDSLWKKEEEEKEWIRENVNETKRGVRKCVTEKGLHQAFLWEKGVLKKRVCRTISVCAEEEWQ
jgi:hypothetical protein